MKKLATWVILIAALTSLASVHLASANNDCSNYTAPVAYLQTSPPVTGIVTGYRGLGGIGTLDSYGCVAGMTVADSRLVLPQADIAVLVLTRVTCTPGTTTTGSLQGLGANATGITLACVKDNSQKTAYVSDVYGINPNKTGTITGSVKLGTVTYSGSEHTIQ